MSTIAGSISPKLLELETSFGTRLGMPMPRGRTNNFP